MKLMPVGLLALLFGLAASQNLGNACNSNADCADQNSICSQALNECKCVSGYRVKNVGGNLECENTYDCRRKNSDCENSAECDRSTGKCPNDCGGLDLSGFSCNVNNSVSVVQADLTNCPTAYEPGTQFCLDSVASPGTYTTECGFGYYGANCEIPRVYAVCDDPASLTVVVNPYTETGAIFEGNVYILDHKDDSDCAINSTYLVAAQAITSGGSVTNANLLGFASSQLNIDETGAMHPCFNTTTGRQTDTPAVGDTTFELQVIIRHNPNIDTGIDSVHTLQCVHKQSANFFADFGSTLDSNVDQSNGGSNAHLFSPVTITIEKQSDALGTPLSGPVPIATPLRLHIQLAVNAKYTSFLVESCVAQNEQFLAVPTGNEMSINLMTQGCADDDSRGVIENDPLALSGGSFTMKFSAFKFITGSQLFVQCSIILCDAGTVANCAATACGNGLGGSSGGGSAGYGRKRRQAGNQETVTASAAVFTVIGTGDDVGEYLGTQSGTQNTVTSESCLQSMGFLVTVCILSALLLLAIIVSLYMCLRLTSLGNTSTNKKIVYKS